MFDLIKIFKKLPKSNWNSAAVGGPPQHAFLPQHILKATRSKSNVLSMVSSKVLFGSVNEKNFSYFVIFVIAAFSEIFFCKITGAQL